MKTVRSVLYILSFSLVFLALSCNEQESQCCCDDARVIQGTLDSGFLYSNVITANHDGFNDKLILDSEGLSFAIFIYDASNNLVYHNPAYGNNFEGLDNSGSLLPEDNYRVVCIMPGGNIEFTLALVHDSRLTGNCNSKCHPADKDDPRLQ